MSNKICYIVVRLQGTILHDGSLGNIAQVEEECCPESHHSDRDIPNNTEHPTFFSKEKMLEYISNQNKLPKYFGNPLTFITSSVEE
jgi:hypothetical protein